MPGQRGRGGRVAATLGTQALGVGTHVAGTPSSGREACLPPWLGERWRCLRAVTGRPGLVGQLPRASPGDPESGGNLGVAEPLSTRLGDQDEAGSPQRLDRLVSRTLGLGEFLADCDEPAGQVLVST